MKKLRNSLLAQYLLLLITATMIIPIAIPTLSIIFYNTLYSVEESPRYYNGTDLETMWHKTAKGLTGASDDEIRAKLVELKQLYTDASLYWVDASGKTRDRFPESLSVPDTWTASYAIDFVKKNRGFTVDPFTVIAFIGDHDNEGFMVLQLPRSDMENPSDKLRAKYNYLFPITLLLVFGLFILICTLFFYRIRKRLLHLQEAMTTSEASGIPAPVEVSREDEIGRLEQSFNGMVKELESGRLREMEEEELRKDLIANLSHDLRTPLTTIRAHAYRLQKEPLSTKGRDSLDFIDEKINYMGELIDNLLSYTLLTTGKYPYKKEKTDIVRLIRTSFAAWYPLFENHQFDIVLDIPEGQVIWDIDPQWMNRILDNLFQNIYRHAKSGKFVAVRFEDGVIYIQDRGPGMEAPSHQKGVGVGLSIVSLMLNEMQVNWEIHTDERGTRIKLFQ